MSRRLFFATLACLATKPFAASNQASDEVLWSMLKRGGYVIVIRHAITDQGIGDPPGFNLKNCDTQRNLSTKGRADAKRMGQAFLSREIPVQDVLSSRWCRCIDTAKLAFERVKPVSMLDSVFNEAESARKQKADAVLASAGSHTGPGNLILVTHAQNIQALTGISPTPGEMIVLALASPDRFAVIGRLALPGE